MKKILWLSSNRFGYELLHDAIMYSTISAVVCLNDDTKTKVYDFVPPTAKYINGFKIHEGWNDYKQYIDSIYAISDINKELLLLKKINPDYIIVAGWRQIIGEEILNEFRNRIIGFHPTLLPFGRGSAPIINTIKKNIKQTGVTAYILSKDVDAGDIIAQERFNINKNDHAIDVYNKVIDAGNNILKRILPKLNYGNIRAIKQNEYKFLKFNKPSLNDNKIDLENESIDEIYNKIRALSKPYNGAYIERNGKKLIIWKAELID